MPPRSEAEMQAARGAKALQLPSRKQKTEEELERLVTNSGGTLYAHERRWAKGEDRMNLAMSGEERK